MDQIAKTADKGRYHHGDLRAALVEATRELVEEKGPDQFSVSEAARRAGVSSAAPYRHFKDRDELLAAACMDGMQRHYKAMEDALAALPPRSLKRIDRLGDVYVRFAQDEPGMFRLIFGAQHRPDSIAEFKSDGADPFKLVVSEVASVLGIAPDAPEAARRAFLLWTFVHGLSFLLIDDKVEHAGIPIDLDAMLAEISQRIVGMPVS